MAKRERSEPSLHIDGYELLDSEYGSSISSSLLNSIKSLGDDGKNIFNPNRKRIQNAFPGKLGKEMQKFKTTIEKQLMLEFPALTPNDMVVLKSSAGCKRQQPHCDYEQTLEFFVTPDDFVPLGCIIPIMEGSTITVWPCSHRLSGFDQTLLKDIKIEPVMVDIPVGKILVFRGDLVHAGSAYDTDNYRIHTFLDSPLVERRPNTTWFMDKASFVL